jgi:hypothetical protein
MTGLDAWLAAQEDRCPGCGFHETQGCACEGNRLKFKGQAIAAAAHPDERAAVDAAIRQLAARGRPFSSNDARPLHNVTGPVVGAAFSAAAKAGLIVRVGYEPSTDPGTHAHPVATWRGVAA